jgi:hypothetical protein
MPLEARTGYSSQSRNYARNSHTHVYMHKLFLEHKLIQTMSVKAITVLQYMLQKAG